MRAVSDDTWILLTLWQEGRGAAVGELLGFAETIRNRIRERYDSDGTAVGTVLHPFAFSGWNPRDVNRMKSATIDLADPGLIRCQDAWTQAQTGTNIANGALLYYNPHAVPDPPWLPRCRQVAALGASLFYRPLTGGG